MKDYQQRVVDEKKELDGRLAKLDDFIENAPLFGTVDPPEQYRLRKQRALMRDLSELLGDRIAAFPKEVA